MRLPTAAMPVSMHSHDEYSYVAPPPSASGIRLLGKGGGGEDNPRKCARHCGECGSEYRSCRQSSLCIRLSSGDFEFGCYDGPLGFPFR